MTVAAPHHRRRVPRARADAIVEGLPAGLELDREAHRTRHGAPPARPRPRRAHEDREGHRRGHRGRPPRPHAGRPDRAVGRQPRLRQLGGADEPVAGRGRRPGGPPPAPRPRRPRRRRRSTASPTCATCSSAPARARPRRAWPAARWPRRSCARSASRSSPTSSRSAASRAARATRCAPEDFAGVDESPVRCLDPEAAARWSARSTGCARPTSRSAASSRCAPSGSCPAWAPRLLGGAPRRPPGPGDLLDPGDQGRGDRRRLRPRRRVPGSEAHDEIFYSEERGYYRETNRAGGLEGGMTTGEPLIVPRRDEAAADADQAAALGRHRDARARAGAARAHRLGHDPRRRRRRRGDGRLRAGRRLPAQVRRRPHRRRARGRARLHGADRVDARPAPAERSSSSASWARASRRPPATLRPR